MDDRCPCGGRSYASWCEPLHDGMAEAQDCEQPMRSRFERRRGRWVYVDAE